MPSSLKAQKAILSLLNDPQNGPIYELGSGWGGLARKLAFKFPKSKIIGYELSFIPYLYATIFQKFFGPPNLSFIREDFFKVELEQMSTLVIYFMPKGMSKLQEIIKPSQVLISNTFALADRKADRTIHLKDLYHSKVYLYLPSTYTFQHEKTRDPHLSEES